MDYQKAQIRMGQHDEYLSNVKSVKDKKPNIVLVFADDMGYGDISCFGSKAIHTPCLDSLAEDGVKMNNFYAASPVCSPSRFSLLTGRYPCRGFVSGVFFPTVTSYGRDLNKMMFKYDIEGIIPDEITSAAALKEAGYKTGIFGKWHLGDCSPHLPTENGFEYFFGSYYSNDMQPYAYYRNHEIAIEAEVDQTQMTKAITSEILEFIDKNEKEPFFIYYASPFPHRPVSASEDFTGQSDGGTYGDCVEELDWSVGQIRKKIEEKGLTNDTLFIFTSDNGPWYEGSPGLHRGRKANLFDGGHIVPFIASWPGTIPRSRVIDYSAMNIDIFPMLLNIAGIALPQDREIDGTDMLPLLTGEAEDNLHEYLYFVGFKGVEKDIFLRAIRSKDNFKYCVRNQSENTAFNMVEQGPFLFNLAFDSNESYNTIAHFPKKTEELKDNLEAKQEEMNRNPRGWIE